MKKIAVVMGGISSEREVSLQTGAGVLAALQRLGYEAYPVDLTEDVFAFVQQLKQLQPDIVFNALHGKFGEDGCIQGLLNMLHIPYTHSGVLASSVGMDKNQTRRIAKDLGIPVADGGLKTKEQMQAQQFPYPYVAKPNAEGSSIGVHIIHNNDEQEALFSSWTDAAPLLIEKYIPGRELSAAVLGGKYLGDLELVPLQGFYDYEHKYTDGQTQHLIPAPIPDGIRQQLQEYTLCLHRALGCRGVSRCDFRLDDTDPNDLKLVFLEINTNPGMTAFSLVPDIAKNKKISYDDIISTLLAEARCD